MDRTEFIRRWAPGDGYGASLTPWLRFKEDLAELLEVDRRSALQKRHDAIMDLLPNEVRKEVSHDYRIN